MESNTDDLKWTIGVLSHKWNDLRNLSPQDSGTNAEENVEYFKSQKCWVRPWIQSLPDTIGLITYELTSLWK